MGISEAILRVVGRSTGDLSTAIMNSSHLPNSSDTADEAALASIQPPRRPSFGRSRKVDIAVSGRRLHIVDDAYSDRVRCDHPDIEDGRALGRGLRAAAELMGRSRVVVLAQKHLEPGLSAIGYETEAVMPSFYNGEDDCVVMGLARAPEREGPGFPRAMEQVEAVLEDKGDPMPPPEDVQSRPATLADAPALAALIDETFAQYPTPSNDPAYVATQIREGIPFRVVEDNGELLACASADLVPEARAAELTDCATRPEARGQGLMRRLLADLMEDLREMDYPTAFTLARARIPGVNVAFSRLGFELRGTMLQSCRIGDGLEDMNVWSRAL